MNENKIKLNKMFNELFDKQIEKFLSTSNIIEDVPKESIIFLTAANDTIKNSIELIQKDEYIDSLCLLRSSFEAIMFALAIYFDKEVYKAYQCYDSNVYKEYLKKKYERLKSNNPKFKCKDLDKKSKEILKPANMRKIVAQNYKKVYSELFYEYKNASEVLEEFRIFYKYLCDFTHPSIVKTYTFKLQNDSENLNNIRTVFKLNINYCKILLLLALNFLTLKENMSNIYDLYAMLFLTDINLITDVDNLKKLMKKYDDYLYLDITRKYFKTNDKKVKKLQDEIKEINETENIDQKIVGAIKDIIIKFDAIDICNKYFHS